MGVIRVSNVIKRDGSRKTEFLRPPGPVRAPMTSPMHPHPPTIHILVVGYRIRGPMAALDLHELFKH